MNTLDLVVLVLILGAGVGGWRLGFVARVFAWAGVAVALALGIRFVPKIVTVFGGDKPQNRASVAVLFLVLVALLGQTLGLGVGGVVHRATPGAGASHGGTGSRARRSACSACSPCCGW